MDVRIDYHSTYQSIVNAIMDERTQDELSADYRSNVLPAEDRLYELEKRHAEYDGSSATVNGWHEDDDEFEPLPDHSQDDDAARQLSRIEAQIREAEDDYEARSERWEKRRMDAAMGALRVLQMHARLYEVEHPEE